MMKGICCTLEWHSDSLLVLYDWRSYWMLLAHRTFFPSDRSIKLQCSSIELQFFVVRIIEVLYHRLISLWYNMLLFILVPYHDHSTINTAQRIFYWSQNFTIIRPAQWFFYINSIYRFLITVQILWLSSLNRSVIPNVVTQCGPNKFPLSNGFHKWDRSPGSYGGMDRFKILWTMPE